MSSVGRNPQAGLASRRALMPVGRSAWATRSVSRTCPMAAAAEAQGPERPAELSRERSAMLSAPQHAPAPSACALDEKEEASKRSSLCCGRLGKVKGRI